MRARRRYRGLVIGALVMLLGGAGQAQELPRPAVEAGTGWAGFVDESLIDHSTFGGAARRSHTYNNFTFVGGGGVRVSVTERVYIAPDFRIGLEDLHVRTTVTVGVRIP